MALAVGKGTWEEVMNSADRCIRYLKAAVLAASIAMTTLPAAAQQEVAPEHFDGSTVAAAKAPVVKHRRQTVAARKTSKDSKQRHQQIAFNGGRDRQEMSASK
jgi:hypothetical protein